MLPRLAPNNESNQNIGDTVLVAKMLISNATKCVAPPDCTNVRFCQFCLRVLLTSYAVATAFFDAVHSIVFHCPKEQVVGAAAGRVITFMTHDKAFWNRTKMQFPRKAMGSQEPTIDADMAIAVIVARTCPEPTALCLLNVAPETINSRCDGTQLFGATLASTPEMPVAVAATGLDWNAAAPAEAGRIGGAFRPTFFAAPPMSLKVLAFGLLRISAASAKARLSSILRGHSKLLIRVWGATPSVVPATRGLNVPLIIPKFMSFSSS